MKTWPRKTLAERFWPKVDKSGDCWLWNGAKQPSGHGSLTKGGHQGAMLRAHRVAWILKFGPIPDGMCVCHKCDNPSCVNPAHLWLGTQADNLRDMRKKGRAGIFNRKGIANGNSRLTPKDVAEIRRQCVAGVSYAELGRRFSVAGEYVSRIVKRKAWKSES